MSVMLWPGTVGPATSTPPRAPGSVRRTSTVDIRRPDGLLGNIVLEGRARDLVTNRDGTTEILGETRTHLRIDVRSRTVQSVESDGDVYGLVQLVGARAGGGFRKALDDALPDRRDDGSLLMLLLDETPGTTLISGSALARALGDHAKKNLDPSAMVDVCAGWEDGGVMVESTRAGSFTYYGQGPAAPELRAGDDALAWHAVDPLDVWDTRRARRIDVTVDDVIHVEGLFRDSCIIADGTEQVIHEYTVLLEADPDSLVVTRASATPGVLPGPQCPKAADSAHRIVGRSLPEIRRLVRDTFAGPTTCTHLNDELRALGDVHALVKAARERI